MSWRVLCENADLAVHCLHAAQPIALDIAPSYEPNLREASFAAIARGESFALVWAEPPSIGLLVELADAAKSKAVQLLAALPVPHPSRRVLLDVALDLGITAVMELQPLMAAIALHAAGGRDAFGATTRSLGSLDRARLRHALAASTKQAGALSSTEASRVAWARHGSDPNAVLLGEARDAAEALLALRNTQGNAGRVTSTVEGIDPRAVLDVIFGPRRSLSDPASKAALAPYGLPLPVEELCASPSRAAAEATRMGYPVRISLASPDLRVWDHPDLSVDMVDNAARVRDTFRQLMAAAQSRLAGAGSAASQMDSRVLGVMVTATSDAIALVGVRATALPLGHVELALGFADPHGRASDDRTITVVPADAGTIERALRRLAGASLLLETTAAQRKARVESLTDVLLRVAAFTNDHTREVEAVELRPLAVLLDGTVEVREACVSVSDCFERSFDKAAGS